MLPGRQGSSTTVCATTGSFIVTLYDEHNVIDYGTQPIDQLGPAGQGVEHYHSNGTKYLQINSECAGRSRQPRLDGTSLRSRTGDGAPRPGTPLGAFPSC